jgi:hypothetical protein
LVVPQTSTRRQVPACSQAAVLTTSPATMAGRRRAPPTRPQRLTRGNADPKIHALSFRSPSQRPLQVQAGPDTAHGVGLGRHERAEEHHRRVTDVLLTTPPYWRTTRRTVAKKSVWCARTVSGSARSANGVDPMASMKSTLTRRRSSRACIGLTSRSACPQPVQ